MAHEGMSMLSTEDGGDCSAAHPPCDVKGCCARRESTPSASSLHVPLPPARSLVHSRLFQYAATMRAVQPLSYRLHAPLVTSTPLPVRTLLLYPCCRSSGDPPSIYHDISCYLPSLLERHERPHGILSLPHGDIIALLQSHPSIGIYYLSLRPSPCRRTTSTRTQPVHLQQRLQQRR